MPPPCNNAPGARVGTVCRNFALEPDDGMVRARLYWSSFVFSIAHTYTNTRINADTQTARQVQRNREVILLANLTAVNNGSGWSSEDPKTTPPRFMPVLSRANRTRTGLDERDEPAVARQMTGGSLPGQGSTLEAATVASTTNKEWQ
ncbi:dissimilatory nitrite reductase [Anopheles sinensis]|uniref:Dissimilatory nitrite reductase n=1 Tax=Anopheles sinensis TaxID=74873 RepID=A0A084VE79_ANOSI|nr:dissimilatory nitrite reductase [Anopheles sinensis]